MELYSLEASGGVIAASNCNSIFLDAACRLVASGALENVGIWNLKQSLLLNSLSISDNKSCATCIVASPDRKHVAVGYEDGAVKVWHIDTAVLVLSLNGHRSAVTSLHYNKSGSLLASGARDTHIIVWDVVGECGLYRLCGHQGEITQVRFLFDGAFLVSSSKDTFLKIWELATQHCVQTMVGHQHEVWCFDVNPTETRLIAGSTDSFLRVWTLQMPGSNVDNNGIESIQPNKSRKLVHQANPSSLQQSDSSVDFAYATYYGILSRTGTSTTTSTTSTARVTQVQFNSGGTMFGVLAADRMFELFAVRSDAEMHKKQARRAKRLREKMTRESERVGGPQLATAVEMAGNEDAGPVDDYQLLLPLRADTKLRSFCFSPAGWSATGTSKTSGAVSNSTTTDRLLFSLFNNQIMMYDVDTAKEDPFVKLQEIDLPGHRSGVRSLAISSDDGLVMTTSSEQTHSYFDGSASPETFTVHLQSGQTSTKNKHKLTQVKIWNLKTHNCIRTLDSGYGLCCLFVPGDRHVLIGTKEGNIELYDLASAECISTVKAHTGSVWSMDLRPDQRGFVTGGAGQQVKFWDFELVAVDPVTAGAAATTRLGVVHVRTLQLTDDVLAVRHSPDGRLLAVSLLDSTIKVFFEDTLKFFLSLYGHKLPAMTIDISSDSTMLISGSADKNIKIWGLDFGDCHRSIFAHQDSIMQLKFVHDTHYFFSVSKDKMLKYWDGDKFEQILSLAGHHAEVWALGISSAGDTVITAGADRSVRFWRQSDEQVFLDEEKENALETMFEAGLSKSDSNNSKPGAIDGSGLSAMDQTQSEKATKASLESVRAGERLMDCIDIAFVEQTRWTDYEDSVLAFEDSLKTSRGGSSDVNSMLLKKLGLLDGDNIDSRSSSKPCPPVPNPLLLGKTAERFMLTMFKTVRSTELEEALLILPFNYVAKLLMFLDRFIEMSWDLELSVRSLLFLLRVHQKQIVANEALFTRLQSARRHASQRLRQQKDEMGYNIAAMKYLVQDISTDSNAMFFEERDRIAATVNHTSSGCMKKAMELAILCDCHVALLIFSGDKLFQYSSHDIDSIFQKYAQFEGAYESLTNNELDGMKPGRASSFRVGTKKRKLCSILEFHQQCSSNGPLNLDNQHVINSAAGPSFGPTSTLPCDAGLSSIPPTYPVYGNSASPYSYAAATSPVGGEVFEAPATSPTSSSNHYQHSVGYPNPHDFVSPNLQSSVLNVPQQPPPATTSTSLTAQHITNMFPVITPTGATFPGSMFLMSGKFPSPYAPLVSPTYLSNTLRASSATTASSGMDTLLSAAVPNLQSPMHRMFPVSTKATAVSLSLLTQQQQAATKRSASSRLSKRSGVRLNINLHTTTENAHDTLMAHEIGSRGIVATTIPRAAASFLPFNQQEVYVPSVKTICNDAGLGFRLTAFGQERDMLTPRISSKEFQPTTPRINSMELVPLTTPRQDSTDLVIGGIRALLSGSAGNPTFSAAHSPANPFDNYILKPLASPPPFMPTRSARNGAYFSDMFSMSRLGLAPDENIASIVKDEK